MSRFLIFLLTFCGGIAATVQPSINARLARKTGVLESASVSFAVGTLVLLGVVFATGSGTLKSIGDAEWWELSGGFLGAFFVAITTLAVPRIGTTATMALIIAAQLIMGILMDHFGLFGFKGAAIDFRRLAGMGLLVSGIVLILKN